MQIPGQQSMQRAPFQDALLPKVDRDCLSTCGFVMQVPGQQSMQRTPFQDARLPDFRDEEEEALPGGAEANEGGSATSSSVQRQQEPFITESQLERYPTRLQVRSRCQVSM